MCSQIRLSSFSFPDFIAFFMHFSPDEVEQGVGRAGHGLLAVLRVLLLSCSARVDDVDHDDAHHHGNEGGPEVVGDGHDAQAAGALGVQGGQTGHQTDKTDSFRSLFTENATLARRVLRGWDGERWWWR